jgi:SAM-dependent methyltransferase
VGGERNSGLRELADRECPGSWVVIVVLVEREWWGVSSSDLPRGEEALLARFGQIDIYVFDQLLRGRITPQMKVLDAGCGDGRNSEYLLRCGASVFGVDTDPDRIIGVQSAAAEYAPDLPPANFRVAPISSLPFPDDHFEAVICCAVLHFAEDEPEFERMVEELWRVLDTDGVLFTRLASVIGIENRVSHIRNRRYQLPDGTERFLVDEEYLLRLTSGLGGELLDPLKTTNVQNLRAMTTWVLKKGRGGSTA